MVRTLMDRRPGLTGVRWVVSALVALVAVPAQAQQQAGARMQILVPPLEVVGRGNQGESLADQIRRRVDQMRTHVSVQRSAMRDAIRQVGAREQDMKCLDYRQLAGFMRVPLVLCGTFEPVGSGFQVNAKVISSQTGEEFVIEPFEAANAQGVAEHILTAFTTYVDFLSASQNCRDYLASELWENALTNCNRALELNPTSETVKYHKARALMGLAEQRQAENQAAAQQNYRESLALHVEILDANPFNQEALYTAGIIAGKLGHRDQARRYFEDYLDLDPGNVQVRLQVALDMNREGDPEGALEIAEAGLATAPDNMQLVLYAGHFAITAAQRLLSPPAASGVGTQPGTAATAPGSAPNSPAADSARAREFLQKGLAHYQRVYAEQGNESDPLMLRRMIQAYSLLDRFDEASDFGERAVAAYPEDADMWSEYANALDRAGRVDAALAALSRVLQLNPDAVRIHTRRARMILARDQLEEALAEFQLAINRNELTRDDASNLIYAYGVQEKYNKNMQGESVAFLLAARDLAESPVRRGAPSYILAIIHYNRAIAVAQDQSLAAQQRARPMLIEARNFATEAGPWVTTQPANVQNSSRQVQDALQQYLEIADMVIQRGR